jgi:ADP-ribosylglycohydrolase
MVTRFCHAMTEPTLEALLAELFAFDWAGPDGAAPAAPVAAPPDEARARRDRVRGMLFGVAIGDALGGPHEFRYQVPLSEYHGLVEYPLTHCSRFTGKAVGAVGQITDDTEMTIALADSIALGRPARYSRDAAIAQYLAWAGTKPAFMGRNTRALFVGVKTIAGFTSRRASAAPSEGNGCLMRCAPLAVLPNWAQAAAEDCAITNPHRVCVAAVVAQVTAARALLEGATPEAATRAALDSVAAPSVAEKEIAAAIAQGAARLRRDVTGPTKGWVVHAIYCAFYALNQVGGRGGASGYQDTIDEIVRMGGDTDTNAAIAGALLGAHLGEAALRAESRTGPNLAAVLAAAGGSIPRPERFAAQRLDLLGERLADVFGAPAG